MSNITRVGHKIDLYADTGVDEIELIKEHIKRQVEAKKLTPGKKFTMVADFGEKVIVNVEVLDYYKAFGVEDEQK